MANKTFNELSTAFLSELAGREYFPCEAMNHRLHLLQSVGSLDSYQLPENLRFEPVAPEQTFSAIHDPKVAAAYYVFSDGSLYFSNNAEDEVWAEASDFVEEKLLSVRELNYCEIDRQLIAFTHPSLSE